MPKKASPLDIMNLMGHAADKKSRSSAMPDDHDEDDMPAPKGMKNPKQAAAISEKKKGNAKAPKLPKLA